MDVTSITYIDRLLSSEELYYLYSKTDVHFSIPFSDSLGGGVIEPTLLGSYPILSNLPSYLTYAIDNEAFIFDGFEELIINKLIEKIKEKGGSSVNRVIPLKFSASKVLDYIEDCYCKALNQSPFDVH